MSEQATLWNTPNATSSPEEGSGVSRSGAPDGPTTGMCGPEAAPAPVSRQQAKAAGLMTLAISGRIGRNSSASAALQQSLENRLMTALDTAGSTLFKLTWKRRRTPLGRSYLERAVSVGQTSGSGFTSWPTPQVQDMSGGGQAKRASDERHGSNLNDFAMLTSWATPRTEDAESSGMRVSRGVADTLTAQSSLAGWVTPSARDWKDTEGMAKSGINPDGSERSRLRMLPRQASLAGWVTPTATDANRGDKPSRPQDTGVPLTQQLANVLTGWRTPSESDSIRGVHPAPDSKAGMHSLNTEADLSHWPTPAESDANGGKGPLRGVSMTGRMPDGSKTTMGLSASVKLAMSDIPGPARLTARGEMLTGSSAGMESGGQLRAGHSRWLMAIPAAWDGFASTAMQSISKLRRRGSKRTSKA